MSKPYPLIFVLFAALLLGPHPGRADQLSETPISAEDRARAEQGDAEAQFVLGLKYVNGDVVEENFPEGARWLQQAAAQGHARAQYVLGIMYYRGDGVELDHNKALGLFLQSYQQDQAGAACYLSRMSFHGQGGLDKSEAHALEWMHRAEELDDPQEYANIGATYYQGANIPQDLEKAVYWFRRGADQDDEVGLFGLGKCFFKGEGVEQNHGLAMEYFLRAAALDSDKGIDAVGKMFFLDLAPKVDPERLAPVLVKGLARSLEGRDWAAIARYHVGLARIDHGAGRFSAALEHYAAVESLAAAHDEVELDEEVGLQLALLLGRLGRHDEAIVRVEALLGEPAGGDTKDAEETAARRRDLLTLLGVLQARKGDEERAVELLEQALPDEVLVAGEDLWIIYDLGVLHAAAGDTGMALSYFSPEMLDLEGVDGFVPDQLLVPYRISGETSDPAPVEVMFAVARQYAAARAGSPDDVLLLRAAALMAAIGDHFAAQGQDSAALAVWNEVVPLVRAAMAEGDFDRRFIEVLFGRDPVEFLLDMVNAHAHAGQWTEALARLQAVTELIEAGWVEKEDAVVMAPLISFLRGDCLFQLGRNEEAMVQAREAFADFRAEMLQAGRGSEGIDFFIDMGGHYSGPAQPLLGLPDNGDEIFADLPELDVPAMAILYLEEALRIRAMEYGEEEEADVLGRALAQLHALVRPLDLDRAITAACEVEEWGLAAGLANRAGWHEQAVSFLVDGVNDTLMREGSIDSPDSLAEALDLAGFLARSGPRVLARRLYADGLRWARAEAASDPSPDNNLLLAAPLLGQAELFQELGQNDRADAGYAEALALLVALPVDDDGEFRQIAALDLAEARFGLGRSAARRGELVEAVRLFRSARQDAEGADAVKAIDRDEFLCRLGRAEAGLALNQGRAEEALRVLREVVAGLRGLYTEPHQQLGAALVELGQALATVGERDQALAAQAEGLEILLGLYAPGEPPVIAALVALGRLHRDMGHPLTAAAFLDQALNLVEEFIEEEAGYEEEGMDRDFEAAFRARYDGVAHDFQALLDDQGLRKRYAGLMVQEEGGGFQEGSCFADLGEVLDAYAGRATVKRRLRANGWLGRHRPLLPAWVAEADEELSLQRDRLRTLLDGLARGEGEYAAGDVRVFRRLGI